MASRTAGRPTATWVPKGGLVKGSRAIKIDITGLAELERVFGRTKPLYADALKVVISRSTKAGKERLARAIPQRTGALAGPLATRYWDVKGPKRPQMGSVSTGAGIGAKGFRYGWALNYGRQIVRTVPRKPGGQKPKSTDHGYTYSARGAGVSLTRAGQPTYGWMTKAARSMGAIITRDLRKAVRDIEASFVRAAQTGRVA